MKRAWFAPLLLAHAVAAWAQAPSPGPADFAWRAPVQAPPGASLVRVPVPADALMRLQSPAATDLRLFDADGKPLAFSLASPPAPAAAAPESTTPFKALPLYGSETKPGRGAVHVRVRDAGADRSVWVDLQPDAKPQAPSARRLPSAIFDTRAEKRSIAALQLRADIEANRPVRFTAWTSDDLAQWTPVPLRGRIYRFEGDGAPANDTLQLAQPLRLEGRYLRLDWQGEDGVAVQAVTGVVAAAVAVPQRIAAPLPAPRADGASALEWTLGFATPIVDIELATPAPNTLVPVRILGRNRASEPWRVLAHTVVWRLGSGDAESTNPPAPLGRASVRWLRVEATHGMRLDGASLSAKVSFDPLQLVFLAGGKAPYLLAAGRADTPLAALPLGMLAAASKEKIESLPAATLAPALTGAGGPPPAYARRLPEGFESRTAILWAVLGAGVLLLGGVAWSLLRQLGGGDPAARKDPG